MPRPKTAGPRHQLDIAVHQLWRRQPEPLLQLATGFPSARLTRVLPERISSVRREADGVALAEGPHGPFLVHLEFHSDTSPQRVARQMYVNGALLYARHRGRCPVVGTAVLLDQRSGLDGQFHLEYGSERLVETRFRVVRLYELPASTLAASPGLAPLCPLGAGATLDDLRAAQRLIEASGREEEDIREAITILYITGGRRFDSDHLRRLLWRTDVGQSSTFMEIYNMGLEQGIQQGVERGVERGVQQAAQQGLVFGERRVLRRLLVQRFGALPDWAIAQIEAANLERLDDWTDHVVEAPSLESLLGGPGAAR